MEVFNKLLHVKVIKGTVLKQNLTIQTFPGFQAFGYFNDYLSLSR